MSTTRKFIITLIIVISILFLWVLFIQRAEILRLPNDMHEASRTVENFTFTDADTTMNNAQINELKLVTSTTVPPGVRSVNMSDDGYLPLSEYTIKSSYNSACTGKYVTLDMVKFVLARGCRFLDFAVFYIDTHTPTLNADPTIANSKQPCVAFSDDPTGLSMKSKNYLRLTTVFQRIRDFAFQAPSPNPNDPLFVHLRIYSQEKDAYNDVAALIRQHFMKSQYVGKLDPTATPLQELARNIVVVLDKNLINEPAYVKSQLPNCVNLLSGGTTMLKYSAEQIDRLLTHPVRILDTMKRSNAHGYMAVEPAKSGYAGEAPNMTSWIWSWMIPKTPNVNLNLPYLVKNYGAQVVEYPFYVRGDQLTHYETFFSDLNMACVPFYLSLPYLERNSVGAL